MTDINTRGKLPFTVVSSSVNTGYAAQLTSSVGYNIDLVNHHKDEYGGIENSPLQSPFTNQHVGGNQYRHVKLNEGTDNSDKRPEGYFISASAGSVKIYGPDVKGVHKPRSLLTRDTTAKSPVNIKNIETSGNIAGNFEHNYQVVQSVGRRTTNNLINDNFIASGTLTTQFINNLLFVHDNFSSYSNGDKLTSNQYFVGDGTSEIRTETTTSDKYFVLNRDPANSDRFLRIASGIQGKIILSYKAVVNRNTGGRYDVSGLNLDRPESGENLLLQYSYDLTTWNTIKTILTGGVSSTTIEIKENTELIDLSGIYYLRFFQGSHTGITLDNYAITNIKITYDNSYALPDITNNSKSIFVERFNAPGGKEVSSRGALDREGEEYAPNNSLVTRNIKIRQPYYNQLTQHAAQFNSGSIEGVTIHAVNRNTMTGLPDTPAVSLYGTMVLTSLLSGDDGNNLTLTIVSSSPSNSISVTGYSVTLFMVSDGMPSMAAFIEEFLNDPANWPDNNQLISVDKKTQIFVYVSVSLLLTFSGGQNSLKNNSHDNFWVQHAIPRTDLRYKWIADSISSSQQPIEYQSYNLPYSTSSFYNSNGAFNDLSFELTGPFGDHLGISGAIDKDEMFVSKYTNTMYRDRKYLNFTSSNDFYVDASSIASEISEKDFTISFWMKTSGNIPSFAVENSIFEYTSSVSVDEPDPTGLFFHPSGTYVYITGNSNNKAYQYTLSTPWDITTKLTTPVTKSLSSETIEPRGLYIKSDGTKLYIISSVSLNTEIIEYSLTTNWDISSATAPIIHPFLNDSTPRDIFFKPDGTELYIPGNEFDKIYQKHLSVPWDITSTGSVATLDVASATAIQGLSFSEDGKHLYLIDSSTPERIYYYYLSVPWNITTATKLSSNDLDISSRENVPTGISINERLKKLYFIGTENNNIYQYSLVEQPLSLVEYSGSVSQNKLLLNVNFSSSYLSITGSGVENTNISLPIIEDENWHFITLVSDLNSTTRRISNINTDISLNTTKTTVYVDGGVVNKTSQLYKKLDVSKLLFSLGRNKEKENGQLDEIMIWDSFLEEEQINKIYIASKSEYGQRPKKYIEHKLENTNVPNPIHVYSSRTDDVANIIFDEIGNRNATLTNYTASVNLYPQNTGIISYSTYFNGPYQGASWKSIRNAEHPITRKLTTENTNIVSTLIPASITIYNSDASQPVVTADGIVDRIKVGSRRSKDGRILNVKESPVYINNKPLKHRFVLKGSPNNSAFELTHTYGNNLQYFANNQLNDTLGLNKIERQVYDTLFDYYNGNVDDNENPIQRLVGYTYSETVFPKPGQALLKDVRQRTDYITDEPGYGPDGYDRQLGTQRVFWRDNQEDRMRTPNSYINSLGNQVSSYYADLPALTPSVAAFEFISESKNVQYLLNNITSPPFNYNYEEIIEANYQNCGELNSFHSRIKTRYARDPFDLHSYEYYLVPSSQNMELFFFKNNNTNRLEENAIALNSINSNLYININIKDPSSLRVVPKFVYEHPVYVQKTSLFSISQINTELYNKFTHDLGLNRITEKESGKNPWYDSYQNYYLDVKNLSNDYLGTYSKLPEFAISDNFKNVVQEYGGDFTKVTLSDYIDNISFNYKDSIKQDNEQLSSENIIKIKINGIKKLLPYNGFYPQDRSLQLVNYFKESYLDTNAIKGGFLTRGYTDPENNIKLIYDDENDELAKQYKISSFLEPFYSPGIFYNLIKSGIAVSWNVYTGSFPIGSNEEQLFFNTLNKVPDYRIDFESLLNLGQIEFSSSNLSSENRILKMKELNFQQNDEDYEDYGFSSFQPFFERTERGSNLYSFAINNFLAETINFFLKDSKLNSFISKPDSDFNFDANKTYYMDIVLKKKDIVMCEAHSSSLFYNFGKMSGRYFGPAFWTGSTDDYTRIKNSGLFSETLRDPAYCAYTPPYFYGDAIARLSFKPQTSGKYSLDDIFNNLDIVNINTGFLDDTIYPSGSLYSTFAMPVGSSVALKGVVEVRPQTVPLVDVDSQIIQNSLSSNLRSKLVGTATNISGIKRWVISSKMEVPVLDFSNQEFITSTTVLTQSYADEKLKLLVPTHMPPTASGFGRGMWSGYGEIPTEDKGIFIELRESYPRELIGRYNPATQTFTETNTGSLLQVCGFNQTNDQLSKKIGEIADSREISEAIVIIPYLDNSKNNETIIYYRGEVPQALSANGTVSIEGHNLFRIDIDMFNHQNQNVGQNKPAVDKKLFLDIDGTIQETSISKMIKLMGKYVIPPNFDFLINPEIKPFVMYIAEFTSTLDKQDLADIWQGVMPKIAMRAEREEQVISHRNSIFDFFHGQGLPKDVKFMIFKVKKRAEINYYKMTADSTDDGLFPSIQVGKTPSPYSFNWPYDYCSLVETARVDVEIDYINKSGSNIT